MNSVTRFVCEDSRSKFIYVEADDKLLSDKGGLTSTALPLLQMIEKTAPNHTLTVVTSVPREISPSNTNPAQNLSALVVFGALLSNYKYRETVRYHETISTQNNPKKNLDDVTFSNRLALHLLNLGHQNGN